MRKLSPGPNFPRYLPSKCCNLNQHSLCLKHILSTTMLSYLPASYYPTFLLFHLMLVFLSYLSYYPTFLLSFRRELKQWVWIQWGTAKFYLHETKRLIYLIFALNWIDGIFHSTICSLHTYCWILHIEQSLSFFLSLFCLFVFLMLF